MHRTRTLAVALGVGALAAPGVASGNVAVDSPPACTALVVTGFSDAGVRLDDLTVTRDGVQLRTGPWAFTGPLGRYPLPPGAGELRAVITLHGKSWTAEATCALAGEEQPTPAPAPSTPEQRPPVAPPASPPAVPAGPVVIVPTIPGGPDQACNARLRAVYRNGAGMRWVRIARARGCVPPRPPASWLCKRRAGAGTFRAVLGPRRGTVAYRRCHPRPLVRVELPGRPVRVAG